MKILVRKWTGTGVSHVLGHADSAMTFVLTFVKLVGKQKMPFCRTINIDILIKIQNPFHGLEEEKIKNIYGSVSSYLISELN